ncbi:MAG: aldo/keto reductase [Treponema sp.]|jgi:predicted aldo/keto reductase-like oxidoreductase|nr:aldo/keto reductase [Treponema sp.]
MKTNMIYRPIGKTGMSSSIIGLGAEHLDFKPYEVMSPVVDAALENGINIIDVFMPGEEVRKNLGRCLSGRRDKIIIQGHIGSTDIGEQYDKSRDRATIQKYFENLLRCLKTDYIDIGMIFFVDSEKDYAEAFEGDSLAYALELKKQGHIRAIGASSHNPVTARKMVETGYLDLLMFSINPAFDMTPANVDILDYLEGKPLNHELALDPDRSALYRLCEQRGTAITVMKAFGGGKLLSPEHTPFASPLTVTQCIHYALTRPAVVSAILGFATIQEMLSSLAYLSAGEKDRDYTNVIKNYQGSLKGSCMYCNHCLPCPSGIDIARVTKYLDIAVVNETGIPPSIAAHYRELENRASDCIACADCESRCPFAVPVVQNMKKATALFGC